MDYVSQLLSDQAPSHHQHRAIADQEASIPVAIVTVSDSRTIRTDENAHYLKERIKQINHTVALYQLVKDEPEEVESVLEKCVLSDARVILFNGGTGISARDRTFDVLSRKLEKTLPGFGELFRQLSYEEIGTAAMMSRAVAGVYKNKIIISVPGSPNAVQLAWTKLIVPELKHLAWEVSR